MLSRCHGKMLLLILLLLELLTACTIARRGEIVPSPLPVSTPIPLTPQPILHPTVAFLPSPMPLTKDTIASCPVSLPNVSTSPNEYYISTINGYQNADGTLFTQTRPQGAVIFARGGPGFILPDGSLAMKWPWWRGVPGNLTIEGQRLDAPAPPLQAEITEGYGDIGFRPVSLIFPTQGCWEVTGKVGKARLTFVTLVVQVPFRFISLNWSPDGIDSWRDDTSDLPDSLRKIINYSNGGELILESVAGEQATIAPNPAAVPHQVMVQGHPGICVQGALVNQQWQDNADAGFLEWAADGASYRINHTGLGLQCDDLLSMVDAP